MKTFKRVIALVLVACCSLNALPAHAYGTQPDLTVAGIGTDSYGKLTVKISNLGTENSESCYVRVYQFGQTKILTIPGVGAGTTRTFSTGMAAMAGQAVTISADWSNVVIESNEVNNTRAFTVPLAL